MRLAGSPGELAGHQDAQVLTCYPEQRGERLPSHTKQVSHTSSLSTAQYPITYYTCFPVPGPVLFCPPCATIKETPIYPSKPSSGFRQVSLVPEPLDKAVCSEGFVGTFLLFSSGLPTNCLTSYIHCIRRAETEAHPGSRAAAAESRNRGDCLLIPRSPFSLRVPS